MPTSPSPTVAAGCSPAPRRWCSAPRRHYERPGARGPTAAAWSPTPTELTATVLGGHPSPRAACSNGAPMCERPIFYPRERCPGCLDSNLEWRPASGRGVVYAVTVEHRPQLSSLASERTVRGRPRRPRGGRAHDEQRRRLPTRRRRGRHGGSAGLGGTFRRPATSPSSRRPTPNRPGETCPTPDGASPLPDAVPRSSVTGGLTSFRGPASRYISWLRPPGAA